MGRGAKSRLVDRQAGEGAGSGVMPPPIPTFDIPPASRPGMENEHWIAPTASSSRAPSQKWISASEVTRRGGGGYTRNHANKLFDDVAPSFSCEWLRRVAVAIDRPHRPPERAELHTCTKSEGSQL